MAGPPPGPGPPPGSGPPHRSAPGPVSGGFPGGRDAWLLAALAAALFVALKLNQWWSLGVHAELAEFETRLWSTLHGDLLARHRGEASFLAQHFSPILLLAVPLYAASPSPLTLLVAHALAAALAVIPLVLYARRRLGSRAAALALGAAFLVSRPLGDGLAYDVHMEILYPGLFFAALLAFVARRWGWMAAALALAACVKEDAAIGIAGVGLFVAASGYRARGLAIAAAAVAWLAVTLGVWMPAFRRAGEAYPFAAYWSGYGDTLPGVLRGLLDPRRHARVLLTAAKLGRGFDLLAAQLFLPLARPAALAWLVLPPGFVLAASSNPWISGARLYYGLLLLPFLFLATVLGLERVGRGRPRWIVGLAAGVLVIQLANSHLFRQLSPDAWGRWERFRVASGLIATLPREAAVSAQVNLVALVPVRHDRFYLPDGLDRAGAALFDTVGFQWPLGPARNRALLDSLARSAGWEAAAAAHGFVLLRRRGSGPPPG